MKPYNPQLKVYEGTPHNIPPVQENKTIPQMKVRSKIRSGYCTWVCDPPPCRYICM